ncbi:fimbrial biogenesis outer membrane usher protein [Acidisoma cellulosilytica]|uniref:Fimbrial biogenesis outer membrane usher protein n=1 Tax=Acidisoma cellulosilyticum TaxID=2802395 RepID=A0A963Z438_9PROT|nr:fimbria/pilus outer membrane usher protein [Acidisoma cellulosilyticum]MCB8881562.1 fimbrial biogenesis outer membrane usher protein [Acidisoma cellulosilyticum]
MEKLGISGQVGVAAGAGYRLIPASGPVSAVIDNATQTIVFTLPAKYILPSITNLSGNSPIQAPATAATGAYFNYNLGVTTPFSGSNGESNASLLGTINGVLFSPWGMLISQTGLQLPSVPGSDQPAVARLSTTYEYDDVQAPRAIRLGDVITTPPGWARGNLMGGFQIASDYSVLQPSTVIFPTPQIGSNLSLPSAVSLLVNSAQAYNGNLNAGPFALVGIPVLSGLNSITVQTRSPSGQVSSQTLPFYVSATMLKAGLTTYAGTVGYLRQNYGTLQDGYSIPATDDTISHGISNDYTGTLHLEASPSLALFGATLETSGFFGDVSVSAAGSAHQGALGTLASVNYTRSGNKLSLSAGATLASPGYYDLAAENGAPFPRLNWYLSAGLSLPYHLGNLNAAYTAQVATPTAETPNEYSYYGLQQSVPDGDSQFLVISYSKIFWDDWSLNVSAFAGQSESQSETTRSNGIDISLSFPLGGTPRGGLSLGAGSSQGPQYGQSFSDLPRTQYGYGVQLQNQIGNYGSSYALFQANTHLSNVSVTLARFDDQESAQLLANGSIAMLDGIHFSSPTRSAFALVDVGYPDIPVSLFNQPIGKTDASGKVFVPGLTSNYPNLISLDPKDLPLSANFKTNSIAVVPPLYGGVVAHFPSKPITDVMIRITEPDGSFPAPGSLIYLKGSDSPNTVIGYDGEALIVNAPKHLEGYVLTSRTKCRLSANLSVTTDHYLKGQSVKCLP